MGYFNYLGIYENRARYVERLIPALKVKLEEVGFNDIEKFYLSKSDRFQKIFDLLWDALRQALFWNNLTDRDFYKILVKLLGPYNRVNRPGCSRIFDKLLVKKHEFKFDVYLEGADKLSGLEFSKKLEKYHVRMVRQDFILEKLNEDLKNKNFIRIMQNYQSFPEDPNKDWFLENKKDTNYILKNVRSFIDQIYEVISKSDLIDIFDEQEYWKMLIDIVGEYNPPFNKFIYDMLIVYRYDKLYNECFFDKLFIRKYAKLKKSILDELPEMEEIYKCNQYMEEFYKRNYKGPRSIKCIK